jgi:uncharacterized protein YecT (DUF1311 family)
MRSSPWLCLLLAIALLGCSDSQGSQRSSSSASSEPSPAGAGLDALVPGLIDIPPLSTCTDGGTAALSVCQNEIGAKAERLLDQTVAELRATALPGTASLLDESQQAWLAYRDATCGYSAAQYTGGSILPVISGACRVVATRDRIRQLQETCDKVPCTPPGWTPNP